MPGIVRQFPYLDLQLFESSPDCLVHDVLMVQLLVDLLVPDVPRDVHCLLQADVLLGLELLSMTFCRLSSHCTCVHHDRHEGGPDKSELGRQFQLEFSSDVSSHTPYCNFRHVHHVVGVVLERQSLVQVLRFGGPADFFSRYVHIVL